MRFIRGHHGQRGLPIIGAALCACGCGQPTKLATRTSRRLGHVQGQPLRFVKGHHAGRVIHGMSGTPEYKAWVNARNRCTNPKAKAYENYGGRGIRFLFTSVEQFFAELGPRPSPAHSVDRQNNDGNYEPGNVRWATRLEQTHNRRPQRPRASENVSTGMEATA
jgi:hypothetical protein